MVARVRRINIVIDPELDDRLEREAAERGLSRTASRGRQSAPVVTLASGWG